MSLPNHKATITMTLPNGERLTVPLQTMLWKGYNLATYPLRVGVGYVLFGWRGAALALVLSVIVLRKHARQRIGS